MAASRISDASINAVRDRVSIEEIIGSQIALRPSGAGRLKGLCPFHDEKTPSFNVNSANGYFHCFGCGESGDAIGFVQKIEGLSFREAIERLARQLGITLTYEGGGSAVNVRPASGCVTSRPIRLPPPFTRSSCAPRTP